MGKPGCIKGVFWRMTLLLSDNCNCKSVIHSHLSNSRSDLSQIVVLRCSCSQVTPEADQIQLKLIICSRVWLQTNGILPRAAV